VAGLLRLTLVPPDIIEAILDGTEPDSLSPEKLYRVPVVWEGQRRMLEQRRTAARARERTTSRAISGAAGSAYPVVGDVVFAAKR